MNYETAYSELLQEVMTLRRKLRAEEVKNVLAKLARAKSKAPSLKTLEDKLHEEIHGQNRGERIDTLIEIIQDML